MRNSLKSVLPTSVKTTAKRLLAHAALRKAKAALQAAPTTPEWLEMTEFEALKREYPVLKSWIEHRHTSTEQLEKPDVVRASQAITGIGRIGAKVLEIGGGPGGVAWGVRQLTGADVTCFDLMDPLFRSAAEAGVHGVNGDACALPFADSSFNSAWSYNAFEHIADPAKALDEVHRVLRPGGRFYLNFAPLYNAPLGLHAFFEIGVPFCQHLWTEDQMRPHVTNKDFWYLNKLPLAKYREIWAAASSRMRQLKYVEELDFTGIELISRFPSCFAKRSRDIEEFTVSKFVITFEAVK